MFFLLLACQRPEVSQPWQIDRLRILAVAAEPPEPRPGDTVTFTSLVVSPDDPVAAVLWLSCGTGGSFGCDTSVLQDLDFENPETIDPQTLLDAGLIGAEPYWAPAWEVPTDFLDALTEDEKLEGMSAMINLTAIPESAATAEVDDLNLVESAFKRIPVSLAPTPNHNPTVTGVQVDELPIPEAGARIYLEPNQTYSLTIQLSDDSIEDYTYRNSGGEDETRTEEPYFTWYAQEGSFDQTATLWPYTTVAFTTPETPTITDPSIWVVVRDRRGGMSWYTLPVSYLP